MSQFRPIAFKDRNAAIRRIGNRRVNRYCIGDTGTRKIVRQRKIVAFYATDLRPTYNARSQNKNETFFAKSCSEFPFGSSGDLR